MTKMVFFLTQLMVVSYSFFLSSAILVKVVNINVFILLVSRRSIPRDGDEAPDHVYEEVTVLK